MNYQDWTKAALDSCQDNLKSRPPLQDEVFAALVIGHRCNYRPTTNFPRKGCPDPRLNPPLAPDIWQPKPTPGRFALGRRIVFLIQIPFWQLASYFPFFPLIQSAASACAAHTKPTPLSSRPPTREGAPSSVAVPPLARPPARACRPSKPSPSLNFGLGFVSVSLHRPPAHHE